MHGYAAHWSRFLLIAAALCMLVFPPAATPEPESQLVSLLTVAAVCQTCYHGLCVGLPNRSNAIRGGTRSCVVSSYVLLRD